MQRSASAASGSARNDCSLSAGPPGDRGREERRERLAVAARAGRRCPRRTTPPCRRRVTSPSSSERNAESNVSSSGESGIVGLLDKCSVCASRPQGQRGHNRRDEACTAPRLPAAPGRARRWALLAWVLRSADLGTRARARALARAAGCRCCCCRTSSPCSARPRLVALLRPARPRPRFRGLVTVRDDRRRADARRAVGLGAVRDGAAVPAEALLRRADRGRRRLHDRPEVLRRSSRTACSSRSRRSSPGRVLRRRSRVAIGRGGLPLAAARDVARAGRGRAAAGRGDGHGPGGRPPAPLARALASAAGSAPGSSATRCASGAPTGRSPASSSSPPGSCCPCSSTWPAGWCARSRRCSSCTCSGWTPRSAPRW